MESSPDKCFTELDSANEQSRTGQKYESLPQNKLEPKDGMQEDRFSSANACTKQGNSETKKSKIESSSHTGLPSKFKNGNASQYFVCSERVPGSSSHLFFVDSQRENDIQWRAHDHLTSSTKSSARTHTKHSDATRSKSIGNVSQFDDRQKSSTVIKGTGYKFLENLLELDPMDVVIKLASSKVEFIEFLKKDMFPDLIMLTLKILAEKVCVVRFQHNKTTVLIAACHPHFLKQLEEQLNKIPTEHQSRKYKILPFLENLLIFYETVVNMLPQTACEKFKSLFITTELSIEAAQRFQNMDCGDIKKKFECLHSQLNSMIEENECSSIKQSSKMEQLQYLEPPDNFRDCSIFPTAEDFVNKPFLRPNITKGAYIDVEHYLDVQFRLLREDCVSPLREGFSQYTEHCLQGQKILKKIDNIRIYCDAKFLEIVMVENKVGVLLKFASKNKLQNVRCANSKSLIFGTLLCFTQDNFRTFFFGTVLKSSDKLLKKGCIVVELCDKRNSNIFCGRFTVAESEVYFEPYRLVLNALQTMPFYAFPMKPYIVDGITEVGLPLYLCKHPDSVIYEIDGFSVPVTEMDAWPTEDQLKLDISQHKSLKSALTKEFVIIQGPPGTGKTFLGLKIMQILLNNQYTWNFDCRPILVVCYTNHALDQVLEGTLQYTQRIIRIGGQSQSKELSSYNISNVRRLRGRRCFLSTDAIFSQIEDLASDIHFLVEDLEKIANNLGIVSISSWKEMGITDEQLKSFVFEHITSDEVFIEWLKGDGNENPDNLFQQDCTDPYNIKISEDLPGVNNGVDNHVIVDEDDYDDSDDDSDVDSYYRDYGYLGYGEYYYDDRRNCMVKRMVKREYNRVMLLRGFRYLIFALELSHLINVPYYTQQLGSCGDNIDDDGNQKQLQLYNVSLYRFFKDHLTQVVNTDGRVIERLTKVHDLWSLNTDERWCLYKHWCHNLRSTLTKEVSLLQAKYKRLCKQYDEIRDWRDLEELQDVLVVGMTTTGAARRQSLLQELKPRIVIVEEAAEVLESHIVVSLTEACEQLILIGDHKQLRPSTAVYELAKKYNMEISLFERMLQNGMHFDCLEVQHRMRPEIANLITPTIYPSLRCGPSVFEYENVKGVTKNLFFINHKFYEDEVLEIMSHRNLYEAEFLIALCKYLCLQGYDKTEITILATYNAQMYYMQKLQKESNILRKIRITVVDNFQGEENKIILLSLVRSNEDANIGFLKVENRVCVALSRAREGFYMIGNMDNLITSSKIWPKINETLVKQDAIGSHLTLKCQVHPNEETKVASAADFKDVLEGGCSLPCEAELPCGHKCQRVCHTQDRDHENYKCLYPCERVAEMCPLGHKCLKKCYQSCRNCETHVEKLLPCQHVTTLACHLDVTKYLCKEVVEAVLEPCKHKTNKLCHEDAKNVTCPFPCEDRLLCGHSCTQNCHAGTNPDHLEYKCFKPCEKNYSGCKRNHKCKKKCFEDCGDCTVQVEVQLSCGHTHQASCSSDPSAVKCNRYCKRIMLCGHICGLKCFQSCTHCQVKVQKVIPDCGHEVSLPCSQQPTRSMCEKTCETLLECGHQCKSLCCQPCTSQCEEIVPSHITPACGHLVEIPCYLKRTELSPYSDELLSRCKIPCKETLECGHLCRGTCGACSQGRLHLPCKEKCDRVQICGHSCNTDCAKSCPPCNQKCEYRCRHSRCSLKCAVPCVPCKEPCAWHCKHLQCTKLCYEICNREPCYEPCEKKLRCGHDCLGFCDDPCPPLCRVCNEEELTTNVFGFEDENDARFVYLEDCKHIIESKALDEWLKQKTDETCLKICPQCQTPILSTSRFLNYLKSSFMDLNNVKEKVFGSPKENIRKKIELAGALRKMVIPDKLERESTEIKEMLKLLDSILQPQHRKRNMFLSRMDLESLSIIIDFISKLLATLNLYEKVVEGLPYKLLVKQFDRLVYLMRTRNTNMTEQEVNDLNLEINKFMRVAHFRRIQSNVTFRLSLSNEVVKDLYKKATQEVKSIERFSPEQDEKLKDILDKMNKFFDDLPLEREIMTREIVKAVGVTPGHWIKCSNGHYCVIGNYRAAANEGKCPDCGVKIGGVRY